MAAIKRLDQFTQLSQFEVTQLIEITFAQERRCQADFILLLREVYRRRIHNQQGYSTMLTYCTEHFRMAEYSAYKRIRLAKYSETFPELLESIQDKRLSLTTSSLIAPYLKSETFLKQIDECAGKSKETVKKIIAGWAPKPDVKDSVRHIKVNSEMNMQTSVGTSLKGFESEKIQAPFAPASTTTPEFKLGPDHPLLPISPFEEKPTGRAPFSDEMIKQEKIAISKEKTCLRFAIDQSTEEKLNRMQELSGIKGLGEMLDAALDAYLDKKDPARREARRTNKGKSESISHPEKADSGEEPVTQNSLEHRP